MKSKSISGASANDVKKALADCQTDGFTPNLAIVFISIKLDRKEIIDLLIENKIDVLGATSSGEFINGHQSKGEVVIMLFDIKKENYSLLFEENGDKTIEETGIRLAEKAAKCFDKPALILLSTSFDENGQFIKSEFLLRSIEKVLGSEVLMFGGMAGDDMTLTGTFVFTNNQHTSSGVAALVLNEDKVELHGMAISGWKPIGVSRTVTKSEGNLIFAIDNQPALEMYLRYLGSESSSTDTQIDFFESVGIHYPFQIEREGRAPWMCNPMGYNKERGALICESDVPEGSVFRFSTPPDFDIIDTISQKASDLKQHAQAEAEALLIFSCAGRFNALGPLAHEENEGLAKVWNTSMAGFYSYGEFGRGEDGKHEVHSTTCCWVALKEKAES